MNFYEQPLQQIPNDTAPYGNRVFYKEPNTTQYCSNCGAKIIANNIKNSLACPFCREASLSNGVTKEFPVPDYMIPFKVSRDEAAMRIRETLKQYFFLPSETKNFDVEMIHGIFLPYWLYDIEYNDTQIWRLLPARTRSWPFHLQTDSNVYLEHFTVGAAESFHTEYSQSIEPYDLNELIPYDNSVLSGYYSVLFDMPAVKAKSIAIKRTHRIMQERNRQELVDRADAVWSLSMQAHDQKFDIPYEEYALLPIWYLNIVHKKKNYIAIVNGQTGKVAVDIPTIHTKYTLFKTLLFLILNFIFVSTFAISIIDTYTKPGDIDLNFEFTFNWGPFTYEILICIFIWLCVLISQIRKFIRKQHDKKHAF